jgi:hypothetical protein
MLNVPSLSVYIQKWDLSNDEDFLKQNQIPALLCAS